MSEIIFAALADVLEQHNNSSEPAAPMLREESPEEDYSELVEEKLSIYYGPYDDYYGGGHYYGPHCARDEDYYYEYDSGRWVCFDRIYTPAKTPVLVFSLFSVGMQVLTNFAFTHWIPSAEATNDYFGMYLSAQASWSLTSFTSVWALTKGDWYYGDYNQATNRVYNILFDTVEL